MAVSQRGELDLGTVGPGWCRYVSDCVHRPQRTVGTVSVGTCAGGGLLLMRCGLPAALDPESPPTPRRAGRSGGAGVQAHSGGAHQRIMRITGVDPKLLLAGAAGAELSGRRAAPRRQPPASL